LTNPSHLYRTWILRLAVLLLMVVVVVPSFAQQTPAPPTTTNLVIVPDLFLRAGPGDTFRAVSSVVQGTQVTALGRNEDATWVAVRARGVVGWVRRDLVGWSIDLFALPIVAPEALTPIPSSTFVPPTPTPLGNWVSAGTEGAFIRSGPGFSFLPLGVLMTGDFVEPVGRTTELDWILIRFGDGFGWIARPLVRWDVDLRSLPTLIRGNLTPSATFTASFTPSATATVTASSTSTATATVTPSPTSTATATLTSTVTPSPSHTASATYTLTPSTTPSETPTNVPSVTPSTTPSVTPSVSPTTEPSSTPTLTATMTASLTLTASPTAPQVVMIEPSATNMPSPTATLAASVTPSETSSPVPSATMQPSATPASMIVVASASPQAAVSAASASPLPVVTELATIDATVTSAPPVAEVTVVEPGAGLPTELIVGLVGIMGVLGYGLLYWRGIAASERYKNGFVVRRCPVCGQGDLVIETKLERVFGIPRGRHIVGCTNCRSVLREAGDRRWRYAVDRLDNPQMYQALNGKLLLEDELRNLSARLHDQDVPQPKIPPKPPRFVDDHESAS
jgi:uncharacterized protein YraI